MDERGRIMIAILIFLTMLCSGSVYCAAYYRHRFEQIIPITAIGAVLLVFLFGIAGQLKLGVSACIALAAVL